MLSANSWTVARSSVRSKALMKKPFSWVISEPVSMASSPSLYTTLTVSWVGGS